MSDAINLNPESFIEGSGLIDDCDAVVKEARFDMFDYNGTADPTPCLKMVLDVAGDETEQYWSMGRADDWIPSDDGKQLLKVGTANSIRLTSNGGIFLQALVGVGFPAEKLGSDISVLDGLEAHFIQTPAPERKGVKKTPKQKEKEEKYGPPTILVVSEILALPWEKKAAGKPKGKKAAPAGAPPKAATKSTEKTKAAPKEEAEADAPDEMTEKATEIVMGILAEGEGLTKKELTPKIFKVMADDPDRNKVIQLTFKDEFLAAGPWDYTDGVLSLG
jgi:hypothetical protein